jgi:HEAT repeat protein
VKGGVPPKLNLSNRIERLAVLEAALDALPFLRAQAKERLVQLLRDLGLDKRLRRQALCASVRDQIAAMEALVLFPDERTRALLERMERSPDLRIWLEALRTRSQMESGPDMMALLKRAERPGARRAPILQHLLQVRANQNMGEALLALETELPPLTRALLLKAIGECQDPLALRAVKRELSSEDGAVRSAAVEALGMLGLDIVGPDLARATGDSDWRVRLKACEAIGELGLWRHAKALAPLLQDPVWWVRLRAEEALQRLGDRGRSALDGAADKPSKRRRSAAP